MSYMDWDNQADIKDMTGKVFTKVTADGDTMTFEAFPSAGDNATSGTLAGKLAGLFSREQWEIEQLRTEEGRLEEVFRAITMPDIHIVRQGEKA